MQTLKSFFASHEEPVGSFAEKNLKIIKKNIQNNILKSNKYVESVGKIKSYKKLLMFLINLFSSENFLEDFHLFEETPLELMEYFIPQIIGYYVTHCEVYQ